MSEDPRNLVALSIDGRRYEGWKSVTVQFGLDHMCRAFDLTTIDRWQGQAEAWALQTGAAVQLSIGGELVLTGWIDEVSPQFDNGSHEIAASGRGRTGDLVDCSAMNTPGHWRGRKVEQIVADLCQPFGISVTADADTGAPIPRFALQQGEGVKDAIDRLVQLRGLLPVETAQGDLVLMRPSSRRSGGRLVLSENVLGGSAQHSMAERFSQYVVKGSRTGDDQDNGATVAAVSSRAVDEKVARYRPLMLFADQADGQSAANRARFAATTRAGKAQRGSFTVAGLRDQSGAIWAHNCLVPVGAPALGLTGDMLISEVALTVSDQGSTTRISVTRPEAYSLGEVQGGTVGRLSSATAGAGRKTRKQKASAA